MVRSDSGSDSRIAEAKAKEIWLLPANGLFSSDRLVKRCAHAKISDRASASFPSICSGDMYWIVAMMLPTVISGRNGVGPLAVG